MDPRTPAPDGAAGERPDEPSVAGHTQTGDLFPGLPSAAPVVVGALRVRPEESGYDLELEQHSDSCGCDLCEEFRPRHKRRWLDPAELARNKRRWALAKAKAAPEFHPLCGLPLSTEALSDPSLSELQAPAGSAFARWRAEKRGALLLAGVQGVSAEQGWTDRQWRQKRLAEQRMHFEQTVLAPAEGPVAPVRHGFAAKVAAHQAALKRSPPMCPASVEQLRVEQQAAAWVAVLRGAWRLAFGPSANRQATEDACRWHPARAELATLEALEDESLWGAGGAAPSVSPSTPGPKSKRTTGSPKRAVARPAQPPSSSPTSRSGRVAPLWAFAGRLEKALFKLAETHQEASEALKTHAGPGVVLKSRGLQVEKYPTRGWVAWREPADRPVAPPLILNKGATNCAVAPAFWRCKGGHSRIQPMGCAKRRCENPGCKMHAVSERVDRASVYLDAFNTPDRVVPLGVVVLPFAAELREAVQPVAVLDAARRAVLALVEGVVLQDHGLDPEEGWRLGGYEATHPEGDKKPGVWLPHFNVLFPLLAVNRETGERRPFKRFRLRKASLERLKLGWRRIQETVKGEKLGRRPVAHYAFKCEPEQREHAKKYFFRGFPGWPAEAQRMRPWGYLGSAVVGELGEVDAMELRLAAEQERFDALQRDGRACETCGSLMWLDLEGVAHGAKLCKDAPLLQGGGPPGTGPPGPAG